MRTVKVPNADSKWHARAKAWYNSLKTSGQSDYYQQSDWELAKICADLITFCYEQRFYKCTMMIAEINTMMSQLGTTEGARRQTMRVELDLPVEDVQSDEDAAIDEIAAALGQGIRV